MKKKILILLFSIVLIMVFPSFNSTNTISIKDKNEPESSLIPLSGTINIYWEDNGTAIVNLNPNYEYGYKLCTDGAGGAIITWLDERNGAAANPDIFAQRIDLNGNALWGDNGTVICNNTGVQGDANEPFENIDICSDGNGGAIITWRDNREDGGDIYAQKIDLNGKTLWTKNGTVVCNSTNLQQFPKIICDGKEGAIITWQHFRTAGDYDIHAQRINSTGHKQWGAINDYNGTIICNRKGGDKQYPRICSDENEGAVITWRDHRSTFDFDIYAQRVNSAGATVWTNNGTVICNETNHQGGALGEAPEFNLCSDGNGGAIITWRDQREGAAVIYADLYAQRINSTGATVWTNNGTAISNKVEEARFPQLCSDDNGGAIITWMDKRFTEYDIYAQRINSAGDPIWTNNGTTICNAGGMGHPQEDPQICRDGNGGAFITWEDYRNTPTSYNIYVQGIGSNGQAQLPNNGTLICNGGTNEDQVDPMICSDEAGNPVIIWRDKRDDATGDIYAQKIDYPTKKGPGIVIGDDDDDDDDVKPVVAGYDLYVLFSVLCMMATIFILKWKKSKNRIKAI